MSLSSSSPLVSIGMTAYNGERFISQALDSLLQQDFSDFEILISDNQSQDRTEPICREFAAKDRRIRYRRNETNLGSIKSFNRVLECARGKYFVWADDHDLWSPAFLSKSVDLLEESPDVVLVYSYTMFIDAEGNPLGVMPDRIDTRGLSAGRRYRRLMWNIRLTNMIYGLMRREAMLKTHRMRPFLGTDPLFLGELSFEGSFAQIQEPLFYRRKTRPGETAMERVERITHYLDPETREKKGYLSLLAELCRAHFEVIGRAPINFLDKALSCFTILTVSGMRYLLRWPKFSGLAKRLFRPFLPKS